MRDRSPGLVMAAQLSVAAIAEVEEALSLGSQPFAAFIRRELAEAAREPAG